MSRRDIASPVSEGVGEICRLRELGWADRAWSWPAAMIAARLVVVLDRIKALTTGGGSRVGAQFGFVNGNVHIYEVRREDPPQVADAVEDELRLACSRSDRAQA